MLEKTFESPLDCRRSNQSILKEINPEFLNWKDWCWSWSSNIWPPDAKGWLIGKDPDAGRLKAGGEGWEDEIGWQRMRWLDGMTNSMDVNLSKLGVMVNYRKACCDAVLGVAKSWTRLSNWTKNKDCISRSTSHMLIIYSFSWHIFM